VRSPPPGVSGWRLQAQRVGVAIAVAAALEGGVWLHQHQERGPVVGMPVLKSVTNGDHVRWLQNSFPLVVDASVLQIDPGAVDAVTAATRAWISCGETVPVSLVQAGSGLLPGYSPNDNNENSVVYEPAGWAAAGGALAITVLTFNNQTGGIIDADIVINGGPTRPMGMLDAAAQSSDSAEAPLDVRGTAMVPAGVSFDLQSLITHEMGHVLGMGEDFDNHEATMFASLRAGDATKRVLSVSDVSGVLTLYHEDPTTSSGCGSSSQPRTQQKVSSSPAALLAPAALTLASARRRARAMTVGLAIAMTAAFAAAQVAPTAPAAAPAAALAATADPTATARVLASSVSRVGGMLSTEIRLSIESCAPWQRNCVVGGETRLLVAGGTEGNLTQMVGMGQVPAAGERVPLVPDATGQLVPSNLVVLAPSP
jgi:hypothetical protein